MAGRGGWDLVVLGVLALALASPREGVTASPSSDRSPSTPKVLSSDFYPCSQCHVSLRPDEVEPASSFHTEKAISGHGEPLRGCFDCHNANDLDALRLVSGDPIQFQQVDTLCGQCHGKIYQAWEAGAYGKRTGFWNGEKRHYSCSECHDPHQPTFAPIEPDPAPLRPGETLRKKRR